MAKYPTSPVRRTSGSARFGSTGAGDITLSQRFDARAQLYLTNKVTGQFLGGAFQRALRDVHVRAATKIAEGMVEELQHRVKTRPGGMRVQRGTERLELSIMHPNNFEATASQLTVGRPSWLDRSPASLYWRRIEEGDTKTFNSTILFTNSQEPFSKPFFGPAHGGGTHMRMPQWSSGAPVLDIGPYPHYDYMKVGGTRAAEHFDFYDHYEVALAAVGIKMSDVARYPR